LVVVDDTEGVFRAGRQEEVVAFACVLYNFEHDTATIRVDWISRGEQQSTCVVQCPSVGKDFSSIMTVVNDEICHLSSCRVDDAQSLAFIQLEGGSCTRAELDCAVFKCVRGLHAA
jgi:hypothetical protein